MQGTAVDHPAGTWWNFALGAWHPSLGAEWRDTISEGGEGYELKNDTVDGGGKLV